LFIKDEELSLEENLLNILVRQDYIVNKRIMETFRKVKLDDFSRDPIMAYQDATQFIIIHGAQTTAPQMNA